MKKTRCPICGQFITGKMDRTTRKVRGIWTVVHRACQGMTHEFECEKCGATFYAEEQGECPLCLLEEETRADAIYDEMRDNWAYGQ